MPENYENNEAIPGEYGLTHEEMQSVLSKARKVYGNKNQIMVCIEELNELACVLAKYPRYEDEEEAIDDLYSKVLDETADVYTILEHVKSIFGIGEHALWQRRSAKAGRLARWIGHSSSMQETIDDRAIKSEDSQ